jgi:antirestriction protein ArdC
MWRGLPTIAPSERRTSVVLHIILSSRLLQVLRGDRRAIFTAASKAQEAANYLKQIASIAQERAS